jgi:hypothetical protein
MDKTKTIKFDLSHSQHANFQISYKTTRINNNTNITFLGMQIDKHINRKTHIGHTTPKLSRACYAIRYIYHLTNIDSLLILCLFPLNNDVWNNNLGSSTDVTRVFKLQKKAVRIMRGVNSRSLCRPIFKTLKILTVPAQYILSLMTFLVQNSEYFIFNHSTETRGRLQLHRLGTSLVSYQKGVYYATVKIYNCLSKCTAGLADDKKKFVQQVKSLLVNQSFYSTKEFIDYCSKVNSTAVSTIYFATI